MSTPTTLLIDVRSPAEFATGHRDGAVNIPVEMIMLGDLGPVFAQGISKETRIECYCVSGARAEFAKMILNKKGYMDVTNLGGLA